MGIPLLLIKSFKKPQIKKFIKQTPPKSRNSDSKYTLEIFKNQKSNSKNTPKSYKKLKTYMRRPQIKKFYKRHPPKSGNSDSKYNFEIFKNQKPKAPKTARRAIGGPKGCWGPKGLLGAQRAPQPLAGARRKGAQHPELLVIL